MVGFWCTLLGFMVYLAEIIADQPCNDICQDTGREEFGWALIGHDYEIFTAEHSVDVSLTVAYMKNVKVQRFCGTLRNVS